MKRKYWILSVVKEKYLKGEIVAYSLSPLEEDLYAWRILSMMWHLVIIWTNSGCFSSSFIGSTFSSLSSSFSLPFSCSSGTCSELGTWVRITVKHSTNWVCTKLFRLNLKNISWNKIYMLIKIINYSSSSYFIF